MLQEIIGVVERLLQRKEGRIEGRKEGQKRGKHIAWFIGRDNCPPTPPPLFVHTNSFNLLNLIRFTLEEPAPKSHIICARWTSCCTQLGSNAV